MLLCSALFSGCGKSEKEENTKLEQTESVQLEETQLEEKAENTAGETTEEETKKEIDAGSSDIAVVEASLGNPAKIGEWVETKKYSAEDKQYHTMYYRITGVVRGDEAKKIVDEYNAKGKVIQISELEKDDLEYGIVTYETYFPKDFPQADYGITQVDADLSLCNLEDSGAISGYIGLSTVCDISEYPSNNEFYAGDTFKDGQAAFIMIKGYKDYLIECSYYEDGKEVSTYVEGQ